MGLDKNMGLFTNKLFVLATGFAPYKTGYQRDHLLAILSYFTIK